MATDYELWATQHGLIDVELVQVLEFKHSSWGSIYITDYGARFAAVDGVSFVAEPVSFTVDLPKQSGSTQAEMSIKLDALGGYVIANIRAMTDADRKIPIEVVWRAYLDNQPNVPTVDALRFYVIDVTANRLAVEIRCAATVLPNVAAGIRYTIERFPSLAFL